jgi:hypothetical protein
MDQLTPKIPSPPELHPRGKSADVKRGQRLRFTLDREFEVAVALDDARDKRLERRRPRLRRAA